MDQRKAIKKINERGILLVFPIKNSKEPASLWSEFYPRSQMRWEWDDNADNKVATLWHLMKKLSASRKVVYAKWYQGRATFFSLQLYTALLTVVNAQGNSITSLSRSARDILDILEGDSPLSTRQLKKLTDLQGRDNEAQFQRAMKELFSRFLIVAYGEVDDGAFPSLAVGATRLLFEDLWRDSQDTTTEMAWETINNSMHKDSKVRKFLEKTCSRIEGKIHLKSKNQS
jgi:hypothetical protein